MSPETAIRCALFFGGTTLGAAVGVFTAALAAAAARADEDAERTALGMRRDLEGDELAAHAEAGSCVHHTDPRWTGGTPSTTRR